MQQTKANSSAGVNRWKRLLYFSNWPLGVTCVFAGFELGIAYSFLFHGFSIDSGLASLVGALFGVGSLIWTKQFNKLTQEDSLGTFIGEGASVVWREAHILGKLCTFSEGTEPQSFSHLLRQQIGKLTECVAAFEKKTPHIQMRSYRAYMEVQTLESVTKLVMVTLEKEENELKQRPTRNVVNIAKKKLGKCSEQLAHSCEKLCEAVGYAIEVPSEAEVGFYVEEIRRRPPKLG